jgi:hypothetical protein
MMFKTQYRVNRDWCYTFMWAVEVKRWWWPFWSEERGLLPTKEAALALIEELRTIR